CTLLCMSCSCCLSVPPSLPTRRSSDLGATRDVKAGDHARLACPQLQRGAPFGRNDRIRGDVPGTAEILGQGHAHQRLEQQGRQRSEEHTSELQSRFDLVCRLLLENTQ